MSRIPVGSWASACSATRSSIRKITSASSSDRSPTAGRAMCSPWIRRARGTTAWSILEGRTSTPIGTASGKPPLPDYRLAGAWRSEYQSWLWRSSQACTSGTSTSSAGSNGASKLIAGRHRTASIKLRKPVEPACWPVSQTSISAKASRSDPPSRAVAASRRPMRAWTATSSRAWTSTSGSARTCSHQERSTRTSPKPKWIRGGRTWRGFRCSFPRSAPSSSKGMTSFRSVSD